MAAKTPTSVSLEELHADRRTETIETPAGTIRYEWVPSRHTGRAEALLAKDNGIQQFVATVVSSWNLTLTPGGEVIPLEPEALLDVPTHLILRILRQMRDSLSPPEVSANGSFIAS